MTEAEIREWAQRSRAAQGLPPTIADPAVLGKVVTLAFAGEEAQGEGDGRAP